MDRMKAARIIVLGIAIAAGGAAAMLAGRSGQAPPPPPPPEAAKIETVDVLIAKANIGIGERLSSSNLEWQTWPAVAAANLINKIGRPNAIEQLRDARARTAFSAGDPIREAKLVMAGSGFLSAILPKNMRAVAVEISPENGAGGFILPGDHVDVILTRSPSTGRSEEGSVSETILSNVQVLAIDLNLEEKSRQNTAVGKIATLELTPRQAQTLVLARRLGTIALVLRSLDDIAESSGQDASDLLYKREAVNIVRFGVSSIVAR
jgi:pilus assembly protein CpaB